MELTYEYAIPDFSLLTQENGQAVYCPPFCSKSYKNIQWHLEIYPNGIKEESKGHLSLFLSLDEPVQRETTAEYKVSILKNEAVIHSRKGGPNKFTSEVDWGFEEFVSVDQLREENNNQTVTKIVCTLVFEAERIYLTDPPR